MRKLIFTLIGSLLFANLSAPPLTLDLIERMISESTRLNILQEDTHAISFLYALAMRESGVPSANKPPDPTVVNRFGYRGMFQFGRLALIDVGHSYVTLEKFRRNPDIWPVHMQYMAAMELARLNRFRLEREIHRYAGTTMNGVVVTEAGILASAHLLGASRVRRYLNTHGRYNPSDGFNTTMCEYMTLFSGYDVNLNYMERRRTEYAHMHMSALTESGRWRYAEARRN